jgi:flagellar biosynthesis protein FliQ
MTDLFVIDIGRQALLLLATLSAPLLLTALLIGVSISIFQAATQINEMTMTFIPKVGIVIIVLVYLLPTMLHLFRDYFNNLMMMIPELIP